MPARRRRRWRRIWLRWRRRSRPRLLRARRAATPARGPCAPISSSCFPVSNRSYSVSEICSARRGRVLGRSHGYVRHFTLALWLGYNPMPCGHSSIWRNAGFEHRREAKFPSALSWQGLRGPRLGDAEAPREGPAAVSSCAHCAGTGTHVRTAERAEGACGY